MENNHKPILYSKISILAFSLFSCFFSGLLYIQNLRVLNKNKSILPILLFSIFFPTVLSKLLTNIGVPMFYTYWPINLLGGYLLMNPFWNYQIEIEDYKSRNVLMPALVAFGIIAVFLILVLLRNN